MLISTVVAAWAVAALKLIEPTTAFAAGIARRDSPSDTPASSVPFPFEDNDFNVELLEKAFEAVASIPHDILEDGDEATNVWLIEHGYRHPGPSPRSLSDAPPSMPITDIINVKRQSWAEIFNCTFEIGKALLNGSIPAAKLLRIQKLIEGVNGAKEAAKKLLKARSWDELKTDGGPLLYELADLLVGISGVAQACFGML